MAAFLFKAADRLRMRTKTTVQCGIVGGIDFRNPPADYFYIDHSYYMRGGQFRKFDLRFVRLTRGWVHQVDVVPGDEARLKRFGVKIEPWRKTGRNIIVIPPSKHQLAPFDLHEWTTKRLESLKTDRPVIVKWNKQTPPLLELLQDAWAVVTWGSVAGVEAALYGVPVFSTPNCPSWAVHAGDDIENPEYKDRHAWACSLAAVTLHLTEIEKVPLEGYPYARRHDMH